MYQYRVYDGVDNIVAFGGFSVLNNKTRSYLKSMLCNCSMGAYLILEKDVSPNCFERFLMQLAYRNGALILHTTYHDFFTKGLVYEDRKL